jgi:hypothetical protein
MLFETLDAEQFRTDRFLDVSRERCGRASFGPQEYQIQTYLSGRRRGMGVPKIVGSSESAGPRSCEPHQVHNFAKLSNARSCDKNRKGNATTPSSASIERRSTLISSPLVSG